MNKNLNKKHFAMAAAGLAEISAAFVEEIERRPSSIELFAIVAWGLKSCGDETLLDVKPANISALKPKVKKGAGRLVSNPDMDEAESAVEDLNDNVFVLASDLISVLANAIKRVKKQAPALDEICSVIVDGLHQCDEDLMIDMNPAHIIGVKAEIDKRRKIIGQLGDVVAIPAKNGEFFLACILAKNQFGTAYGFFEGTSKPRPISAASHPPALPHPIYSDNVFVASGRWQIIAHDEDLRSLFPAEPEIYHTEDLLDEDNPKIGPYGAGETVSGKLRQLTKNEAEEIGIFSSDYNQVCLAEELEDYLNRTLRRGQRLRCRVSGKRT